jgi:hypothetical protein
MKRSLLVVAIVAVMGAAILIAPLSGTFDGE